MAWSEAAGMFNDRYQSKTPRQPSTTAMIKPNPTSNGARGFVTAILRVIRTLLAFRASYLERANSQCGSITCCGRNKGSALVQLGGLEPPTSCSTVSFHLPPRGDGT